MNSTLAVFRREVVARRDLVWLALAAAVLATLMPLLPGLEGQSPEDVRSLTSQVLAMTVGWVMAVGLGATVFGGDLSAGRLGFFFSRPLGPLQVWFGRILAVVALVLLAEFVIMIPSFAAPGTSVFVDGSGWWELVLGLVAAPFFLVLAAHAVSIMLRARTAWLFLDLVGLVAVGVVMWVALQPLVLMGAPVAAVLVAAAAAAALLIALIAAGAAGLVFGRTDLRRTHGALSVTLWLVSGMLLAGVAAYGMWLRSFDPSQFDQVDVSSTAPDGRWIEAAGNARWRFDVWRRYLVSTVDDRSIPLPSWWRRWSWEIVYSADASTAAWLGGGMSSSLERALYWTDLSAPVPEPRATNIVVGSEVHPSLSPDGSRVALLEDGTLSVHDLVPERLVKAIRLPVAFRRAIVLFQANDRLRLFVRSAGEEAGVIQIVEVDLGTGGVLETGKIEDILQYTWIAVDSGAERLILNVRADHTAVTRRSLHDASNGSLIRELTRPGSPRFLEDGRVVFLTDDPDGRTRLVVESADGLTTTEHFLGTSDWEGLVGEGLPGQVIVGRLEELEERQEGRRYVLVDVDSGEVRTLADEGLRRAHPGLQRLWGRGGMVYWHVGAPESNRIFTNRRGAVVRWDPETGDLKHIVGGTG